MLVYFLWLLLAEHRISVAGASRHTGNARQARPSTLRTASSLLADRPGNRSGAVPAIPAEAAVEAIAALNVTQAQLRGVDGRLDPPAESHQEAEHSADHEDHGSSTADQKKDEKKTPAIFRPFMGDSSGDEHHSEHESHEHASHEHASHEHAGSDHCFGLSRPMCALVLSGLSGVSLPVGAAMGIWLHPVNDAVVAALLAIGGGSLLFAVTVELYGHALHELSRGKMAFWSEMAFIMVGAVTGSWFYTWANEWLESKIKGEEEQVHAEPIPPLPVSARGPMSEDERRKAARSRAKQLWWKVRIIFRFGRWVRMEIQKPMKNRDRAMLQLATEGKPLEQVLMSGMKGSGDGKEESAEVKQAKALAMSLFLGLVIDGVPECMLMGFLAAEERLTMVLVISLIVANFPEAFSSASLLKRARMSNVWIVGLWAGLMTCVGLFSGLTCYLLLSAFPRYGPGEAELPLAILIFTSFVEGLAGGAMITLIAAVILPEAMEKADKTGPIYYRSGFCCACGFLLSVMLKVTFNDSH